MCFHCCRLIYCYKSLLIIVKNDLLECTNWHYNDVIMNAMASQITGVSIVWSNVGSDADQRKRQSSASLAFVWGIHRWPVNSPHKGPVTRKMFSFDDVIMGKVIIKLCLHHTRMLLSCPVRLDSAQDGLYDECSHGYNLLWYSVQLYKNGMRTYIFLHFLKLLINAYLR